MLYHGDEEQQRAFSGLYVNQSDHVSSLPYRTMQVDSYQDMALNAICGYDNIVIAGGHQVGPLNHFINAFLDHPRSWETSAGYYFPSAPISEREKTFSSYVNDYKVEVDEGNSLVLNRVRDWWHHSAQEWNKNWDKKITEAEFVPSSVMAGMYYRLLLKGASGTQVSRPGDSVQSAHCSAPDVSTVGEDIYIHAITYLAPILHMIADACVPHHVRCTLGCGHEDWEGFTETEIYHDIYGSTFLDFDLINELIVELKKSGPFEIQAHDIDALQFLGMFSPERLISAVADQTRERVCKSTGKHRYDLYDASEDFWEAYVWDENSYKDRAFLYNLAVAASSLMLTQAHHDLVRLNYIKDTITIIDSLPKPVKPPKEDKPSEHNKKLAFYGSLLGLGKGLDELISEGDKVFNVKHLEELNKIGVTEFLDKAERYLVKRFIEGGHVHGPKFNPVKINFSRFLPDLHPFYGASTYRLPSQKELTNLNLRKQYQEEAKVYRFKATMYEKVFFIAASISQKTLRDDQITDLRKSMFNYLSTNVL